MIAVRIDAPGAGGWVMERAAGYFREGWDHAFTAHDEAGEILGGFVLAGYTGGSMTVHMAGKGGHWCSRELLWMVFHYAFEQLQVRKLLAAVCSDNAKAIELNLRAGWRIEAIIEDVFPDGAHMYLLSMTKGTCPWLKFKPRQWRAGAREAA